MKYDALIKKLEARACGGHPDGARQDGLAREAADAIVLLQTELTATRKALEKERERCAAALDEHQEGGHEGEETFSMIVRQRVNRVLKQASEIIRALPSPQVKP